ncbi:MAG TPA: hypothetical protein VLF91_05990 [Candidatus Saccharimonadales bacterium]|nr:hypothetical protein [Candidatus Saccharimonadales bacterium]
MEFRNETEEVEPLENIVQTTGTRGDRPATARLSRAEIDDPTDASADATLGSPDHTHPTPADTAPRTDAIEETDGASPEDAREPALDYILNTKRTTDASGTPRVAVEPVAARAIAAARAGEDLIFDVRRHGAPGTAVEHRANRPLVPPNAGTSELPPDDASGRRQHEPDEPLTWVRMRGTTSPDTITPGQEEKSGVAHRGTDTTALAQEASGPFGLVIRGKALPDEAQAEVVRETRYAAMEEESTLGADADRAAAIEQKRYQTLARAAGAVVRLDVVVGGVGTDGALEVADVVAGSVMRTPDRLWEVETDERGRLITYASAKAALDDAPPYIPEADNELDLYMSAGEVAQMVRLPEHEVPGYDVVDLYTSFQANRTLPAGTDVILVGKIIDPQDPEGKAVVDFPVPVEDLPLHTIVVGTTGGGKTVLIKELARALVARNDALVRAAEAAGESRPEIIKVTFIDPKKKSSFGQDFADELAGLGVAPEFATVREIRPGTDGLRPTLDVYDPATGSLSSRIDRLTAELIAGVQSGDETLRMLERYVKDGIQLAFTTLGWDLSLRGSPFPLDTPAFPRKRFILYCIRASLAMGTWSEKQRDDIGQFVDGQVASNLAGAEGDLFADGMTLDGRAQLDDPATDVLVLSEIVRKGARNSSITAFLQETIHAQEERNREAEESGTTRGRGPQAVIIIDEAESVFGNDAIGAANAELLTRIRELRIGVVLVVQDLSNLHPQAISNINNAFGYRMPNTPDRKVLEDRTGVGTGGLQVLAGRDSLGGRGIAFGVGMDRPVRHTSTPPAQVRRGRGNYGDATPYVRLGLYDRPYTGETIDRAEHFLLNHPLGREIRAWAELNAFLMAHNFKSIQIDGKLREALIGMKDADMRDCAAFGAIEDAVDSRSIIINGMTRRDLQMRMARSMLPQLRNEEVEEVPLHPDHIAHSLDFARYGYVQEHVDTKLEGERLPAAYYVKDIRKVVIGDTAKEQLDSLDFYQSEAAASVGAVVVAEARQQAVDPAERAEAVTELGRLIGGTQADRTAYHRRLVMQRLGRTLTADEEAAVVTTEVTEMATAMIEADLDRPLTDSERAALRDLLDKSDTPGFGYGNIWQMLQDRIDTAAQAEAIDLSDYENAYGESFSEKVVDGEPQRFTTIGEQAAHIANLAAEHAAKSEYAAEGQYSPGLPRTNLLLATDLRAGGGTTLDNVVEQKMQGQRPQGVVFDHHEQLVHKGKSAPRRTLVSLIAKGAGRWVQWRKTIAANYLYNNDNLRMSPPARRFLGHWVSRTMDELLDRQSTHEADTDASTKAGG